MDAQFARPADKPPLRRPPLITPSASPPVSRIRNRPPAAKRPRLSATPSASSSAQRSSSVANDLDAERTRLESLDRLFKTWDQLAERYHKPLDEDDIVDLRDLAILKDRGVTRGTAGTYAIGSMIVPTDEASSQAGDDDNTGEEEEEESADELDLISDPPGPSVPEEYKKWYVPPADQTNPEDAEMFREFEEAEKKMRELYGLDGDEATAEPEQDGGSEPPLEGEEEEMDEQMVYSPAGPKFTPQRRRSRPPPKTPGDDLSEDEFAAWDFDETPVPQRRSAPLPQPAADDDDIIDLTGSPEPSPPKPKPTPQQRGRSRPGPQPENRARSHTRSNSKPPNPAPAEKRDRTPEIGQSSADEQLVLQLLTPPRSSSAPESITSIPDHESAPSPLPPAETPSPKFPKPRARYTPRPRTPSDDEDDDLPPPPPPLNLPFKVGPPRGVKKQTAKKQTSVKGKELKVEVFISVPPKKLNGKAKSARPPSPEPPSTPSPPPSKSNKGKGKEKAVPEPPSNTDIAPTTLRRRRSQSQPRLPTRVSDSPQPLPPPRGTKRRRVSSLSSLSDSSPARPVTPDPISVPRNAARTNRLTRSGSSKSGYSSDIPPPTSSPVHSDADDGRLHGSSGRVTMLKISAQTTRALAAQVAAVHAQPVSRLTCHHTHTHLPCSLLIPGMAIARRRAHAVINRKNDTLLPFQRQAYKTHKRSLCSHTHGTVYHTLWHRGRSQLLRPQAPAILQASHSRMRLGRHTPQVTSDIVPIRSTRLHLPQKQVPHARRHTSLRHIIHIRIHTPTTRCFPTVPCHHLRPYLPLLRHLPLRYAPPPYLLDSGVAPGGDASRSSWTSTTGRSRSLRGVLTIPPTTTEPSPRVHRRGRGREKAKLEPSPSRNRNAERRKRARTTNRLHGPRAGVRCSERAPLHRHLSACRASLLAPRRRRQVRKRTRPQSLRSESIELRVSRSDCARGFSV
ncbi:hypothetical protein L227DRAFT_35351 [Lentinus tigrinus ALCF2SS1-6]|uniref:Uncharacterized protein n=1 Tax=Lentinus tigrinus ALCF2SS1-6 TaxID=1328759 RepID=A0A5C2SFH2_9APHY|nr:hypothetical protein L227DRAFT_35351 [Lentinus tigrinus ALCF2SS1-6]